MRILITKTERTVAWGMIVIVPLVLLTAHTVLGEMSMDNTTGYIMCSKGQSLETMTPVVRRARLLQFTIIQCPIPKGRYVDVLNSLNIDMSRAETLWVSQVELDGLQEDQFSEMNLKLLKIISRRYGMIYTNINASNKLDFMKVNQLSFRCGKEQLEGLAPVVTNRSMTMNNVEINRCIPPKNSYVSLMRSLNIVVDSNLTRLKLELPHNSSLVPINFEGFHIKELEITKWNGTNLIKVDGMIFNPLAELENITFNYVQLSTLAETTKVKRMVLKTGNSGTWGGCSELQELELEAWDVRLADDDRWLAHCPKLTLLVLKQMTRESIEKAVIGAKSLTSLTITNCLPFAITDDLIRSVSKLKTLKIIGSPLYDNENMKLTPLIELQELKLIKNSMVSLNLTGILEPLQSLRNLTLNKNNFSNLCSIDPASTIPVTLERVYMRNCSLTQLCFQKWCTLKYLDLFSNRLTHLTFTQLPYPAANPLVIDLRNNPFKKFPDTEEEYNEIVNHYSGAKNLTILMNALLDCDCKNAWFARTLRALRNVKFNYVWCNSRRLIQHLPVKLLECDKSLCGSCICRRSWRDNTTVVNCIGANVHTIPRIPNMRVLQAYNNRIENLDANDFPKTLLKLDLRNNRISRVKPEVMAAMLAEPARRVELAGNPFICDCENVPLLKILQERPVQVVNYYNLTCVDSGLPIDEVEIDTLCDSKTDSNLLVALATSAGLGLVVAIVSITFYRFRNQIKIFLYIRGYCLCCLKEEELDEDREFDAFVSFSHEDENFVFIDLLPQLELDNAYKLCVHTRDWVPGLSIPEQIVKSVNLSRRTIIVLSQNFVKSLWGMLEFQTAYKSALEEKRVRVIIVVLDDVIADDQLDQDLKNYINLNTYVKWRDPWFWKKLQLALPHRREELKRILSRQNHGHTDTPPPENCAIPLTPVSLPSQSLLLP